MRRNPGFSVRVWGNADLVESKWALLPQIAAWFPLELNGAADVMRWEILYHHGGVAVDAESRCTRGLEDWLLEPDCFAVWENEIARPGLIACGAMGCVPRNPLIGQIIHDIAADSDLTGKMAWEKVGPGRITETVRAHRYTDITVYPSHYFIPRHFSRAPICGLRNGLCRAGVAWNPVRSRVPARSIKTSFRVPQTLAVESGQTFGDLNAATPVSCRFSYHLGSCCRTGKRLRDAA